MRRSLSVLSMLVMLGVAYGANVWYVAELRTATAEFRTVELAWLMAILPVLTAAMAVGLGWLVLTGALPDAPIGLVYAVVGLGLVFAYPTWSLGWWTPPGSVLVDLTSGLMIPIWLGAGVAAIGLAELLRWVSGRSRSNHRLPAWGPSPKNQLSR